MRTSRADRNRVNSAARRPPPILATSLPGGLGQDGAGGLAELLGEGRRQCLAGLVGGEHPDSGQVGGASLAMGSAIG
jgi:hypothetical protein